jgi:hypothetical protein
VKRILLILCCVCFVGCKSYQDSSLSEFVPLGPKVDGLQKFRLCIESSEDTLAMPFVDDKHITEILEKHITANGFDVTDYEVTSITLVRQHQTGDVSGIYYEVIVHDK